MSGSFEERVHVVPAGRVRTIYDAIPATITPIAITATTIRTVRGFLFPPRGSIPGGAPPGSSLAATRSPPVFGNVPRHITLCAAPFRGGMRSHPGCVSQIRRGAITSVIVDKSLTRMCSDGPAVSLNGSPTVSPTTAALLGALPFPPSLPAAVNVFVVSHTLRQVFWKRALRRLGVGLMTSTPPWLLSSMA